MTEGDPKVMKGLPFFMYFTFPISHSFHINVPQNGLRPGEQSISSMPNFLTHRCPNLSTERHLFRHTEILRHICNDCLCRLRIFCGPLLLQYGVMWNVENVKKRGSFFTSTQPYRNRQGGQNILQGSRLVD